MMSILRLPRVLISAHTRYRAAARRPRRLPCAPGWLAGLDRAFRQIDDEVLATMTASERASLNGLLAQAVEHISADCTKLTDEGC
jgi:hypothetical protein